MRYEEPALLVDALGAFASSGFQFYCLAAAYRVSISCAGRPSPRNSAVELEDVDGEASEDTFMIALAEPLEKLLDDRFA